MGASQNFNISLNINANAQSAEKQLQNLQKQLQQISNMKVDVGVGNLAADIEQASQAAMKLSAHLATATNPQTGNLDFTKFYSSIQKSGASLEQYGAALQKMGPAGQKAFVSLADSISKSEIPLKRTSKMVDKMWDGLKRTAGWQLQSSIIHGVIGGVQKAVGYAKDLNKSLTDIRIVTGQSTDQMAKFAREANKAAKNLSTTTTDYTRASLIYYQQGLSDAEVKARTETTIKMANATGTSAQKVSDQMTAIWNNYDNGTKSLTHYADVMAALGAATASSTDEIAQGLQKFASISNTVGLSYEYAASALATITAESRESADVVGNALKTLFSRIQGLQLGETLDDGTTLNKYSTALAKVGISIKDQAGGLKDMDDILDEMGSKWDTLARDEKMALAQTVAGVRQYTQLMTLMENWDDFKTNLNIANTSTGTLDQQAAIYADSWEAASNRVRASFEGLWDTMVNSEGFITLLDGLSGIIKFADKLAESMGGATGVLSSFAGIATKLLAPKLSQGLRDTAYNVAMLFGGEEKMKKNRSDFLQKASKQISVEGELGSLYGAHESSARQAAMMNRIQSAQDYADNYDHMTDLQRMVEEQYADAVAQADERVIGAAQSLDERKNNRYDARMEASFFDDDNTIKNFLDMTSGEAQVVTADQAMNAFLAQFQDTSLGMENIQANADYARLEAAQVRAQKVHGNQTINEQTVGQNLGGFAKSLQSLYDVVNSPDTQDSTKHIAKLKSALDDLSKSGYDDEKTKKRIESIKSALDAGESVNFDGLYNDLMSYQSDAAAGGAGGLSSTFNKWLTEEFAVLTGESNLSAEERRRQNLESGRKSNMQKQNNVDWANTMVSAGEAMMFAFAAGQSFTQLGDQLKQQDLGGSLMSLASGFLNFGGAVAGFESIFKMFSKTAPKAGKWGLIAAVVSTAIIPLIDLISDKFVSKKEKFQQTANAVNELSNAYMSNKNQHTILQQNIASYQKATTALNALSAGTDEWANSLYDVNSQAINLIADNNLQEGKDYTNIGGQYKIFDSTLKNIEEASAQNVEDSKVVADMAKRDLATKTNENQKDALKDRMLDSISPSTWESIGQLGISLAEIVGGVSLIGSGLAAAGVLTVGSGGTLAAPSIYGGTALAALGATSVLSGWKTGADAINDMTARSDRKKEFEGALDYLEKNGVGILSQSVEDIASTLGVSSEVAQTLKDSTDVLTDWHSSVRANTEAQKAATESTVRGIVSDNKNAQAIDQNTKIIDGATEQYTKAYNDQKSSLEETFKSGKKEKKYSEADAVKDVLGLDNLDNFHWTGDEKNKTQLTYSYIDENGKTQEGAVSYGSIIAARAHQAGTDFVNNYTDAMSTTYKSLQQTVGKDAAGGFLSLLTGGDFDTATKKELDAAKKILSDPNLTPEALMGKLGMDAATFTEKFGMSADALIDYYKNYESVSDKLLKNNTTYQDWAKDNANIVESMSENTARDLYSNLTKISSIGGEEAGGQFLNGLTMMLKDSGLKESDYGAAMERLMSLDWASSTAVSDAASIISGLGGTLDTASLAWQTFAASMAAATNAVPDFTEVIAQLTELLGILNSAEVGDVLDASFVEEMMSKYPEFKDLVMKTWDGNYKLTGDATKYQDLMQQEVSTNYDNLLKNKDLVDKYFGEDGTLTGQEADFRHIGSLANSAQAGSYSAATNPWLAFAGQVGYSQEELDTVYDNLIASENALNAWNSTGSGATGVIDGKAIKYDATNDQFYTTDANGNRTNLEGVEAQKARDAYNKDVTNYQTSQATADAVESNLNNIVNMDYDLATEEGREQFASTFNSSNKVMEAVMAGNKMMVEDGIISDAAMQQLQVLPETSTRATEAIAQLAIAKKNLENATPEEKEDAQRVYDQALAYTELQTAIDAAAAARGLDADMLAQQTAALQQTGEYSDYTTDSLIAVAAEMLEHKQAIDELNSSYSDLASKIRSSEKGTTEWMQSMVKMKKLLAGVLNIKDWNQLSDAFILAAESSGLLAKAAKGDKDAISDLAEYSLLAGEAIENGLVTEADLAAKGFAALDGKVAELANKTDLTGPEQAFLDFANNVNTALDGIKALDIGEIIPDGELHNAVGSALQAMDGFSGGLEGLANAASQFGLTPILEAVDVTNEASVAALEGQQVATQTGENSFEVTSNFNPANFDASSGATLYKIRYAKTGGGGSAPSGGGGGGGGGGPKKVANKRKSQTVKRYKKPDFKRDNAQSAKKSVEKSKDYLYGESKIAQMEKINKLAEKEAHITSDRIKESQKYLKEDRENLIKVMQKWGYDATFDEDGFLTSYEEAWTKVHEKIAKLYEDNELTADEQKLEEDYKVELEELEGALEDYENSLKELQADIEAYEESLYEMYDNKIEQMQHKVEFRIELNEDDLSYLDFWIEALGDSLYNALESLQTMGQKTDILFDGINTYKEGIEDIYALSDDPLHTWATGGLDEVLTQDQVDALRENRDGLMDYMKQLLNLRDTMQDKVLDTFDKWQEKLNATLSTIEHYGSVMEHFKNIIDIVGKDVLGLSDRFMSNLTQSAVDQSMDNIEATKAHYDSLVEQNATAQQALEDARARGDQSSVEHWEKVVQTTTEEMQSAQDALLSSLENTLTMIAEQFEQAMTQAVEAFNDAIYAHGGLAGLQEDYSLIREQADLMAEDYDKIYQLSKLNRNINKTLNDSNIIAGKQKMKSLQQEINELQASGVELSKYDLDYLQAKYELRLAELELENAKNNKDTVRLSKDSEGNWSYVYTTSMDKVDEAQQKYEDALYAMQNLSYEYMEEMSAGMMNTSLAMMEEIQALRIQDFNSYEEYSAEVQRIQDKYRDYLSMQQDELNKSVANNEDLYNKDWQSYSAMTGYKISANQDWADNYSETTLGMLLGSSSTSADFADNILNLSSILINDLGGSAITYFANVETAMNKYGSSISGFGSTVTTTVNNISTKSKTAAEDMKSMAADMNKSFADITAAVTAWQTEFSKQIDDMLAEIGDLIKNINLAIQQSANLTGDSRGSASLIGTDEAVSEINKIGKWGELSRNEDGSINIKGFNRDIDGDDKVDNDVNGTTIVAINAALIREIDEMMRVYFNLRSDSPERTALGEQLKQMFKDYHEFRDIVSRIYDITDLQSPTYAEPASMDTGGYTGEWGSSGKLAMLHEKELVLNANDTANFLDALNISRDVINRMIEMNAMQSSLGFGNLEPAALRDFAQNLEQQVSITAEFPNAIDHNEIEEAFGNLINQASQYAHRYK